jgi:hypothetical protein
MRTAEEIYELVKTLPEPAVREILDFIEFIEMKHSQSVKEAASGKAERLCAMRAARGIWQDRTDLPDFQAIRREWDRAHGDLR